VHRVGIFAATIWETKAVQAALGSCERTRLGAIPCFVSHCGGLWVYLIQSGIGPSAVGAVARRLLAEARWDAVLSAGFACDLGQGRPGALLIGNRVRALRRAGGTAGPWFDMPCDGALLAQAASVLGRYQFEGRIGPYLSVDRVLWTAAQKRAVAELFGGMALDMESAALAVAAQDYGVPFAIVRAASDLLDDTLPMDFNQWIDPSASWFGKAGEVASLLFRPERWGRLVRLHRQSRQAAAQLTGFFERFLPVLVEEHF
jgi:adenosylhomocysteine nucleosidase